MRGAIKSILLAITFMILLAAAEAEAKCAVFPEVAWWGKISHEGVQGYVKQKHGGAWAGYLDKWRRQLARVKVIQGRGLGIKIPSTGQLIKGQQLNAYIANLAQRVEINQCLSQAKENVKSVALKKTRLRLKSVTPYSEGLREYKAGNFKEAYEIWLPFAYDGNSKAQNALGHLYRNGLGVEADIATSRQWYVKSAATGDPVGLFNLGRIGIETSDTLEATKKAVRFIEDAAMQNYPRAQFILAKIHKRGVGVTVDNARAFFWATLAMRNKYEKVKPLLENLEQVLPDNIKRVQLVQAEDWLTRLGS